MAKRTSHRSFKRKTAKHFKQRDKRRAIQWRAIKAQLKQSN